MADVKSVSDADDRQHSADRGQLLLVGALALAVLFVALALLLNTAIYTGNLATRDAGVDGTAAIDYVGEAESAGEEAIRSVNYRNNTTHDALSVAFRASMGRWDDLASHHRAVAGDVAAVEVADVTNGTRIQQDNASRNFTNESGAANWTVAADPDLSGVRSMRLTVDESSLPEVSSDFVAEDVFHVNVSSDAGDRSLFVYDNTTESAPAVRVVDDGTVTHCAAESTADGTFVIDVSNGSVGGASCPALSTVDDVGNDTSIAYRDGANASGTYTMVIDEPDAAATDSLASPGSGKPYATPAIYGAEFRVTYRTTGLDYEARIEAVPR
jgi:hypothetical protein